MPSVRSHRWHLYVYTGATCTFDQMPPVCLFRCHLYVCPDVTCTFDQMPPYVCPDATCKFVQMPSVRLSRRHLCVCPDATCTFVQMPSVRLSRRHLYVCPDATCTVAPPGQQLWLNCSLLTVESRKDSLRGLFDAMALWNLNIDVTLGTRQTLTRLAR